MGLGAAAAAALAASEVKPVELFAEYSTITISPDSSR